MFESLYIKDKTFDELSALFFCHVTDDTDYYDVIAANLARNYQPQLESMLPVLSAGRLRAALCGIGLAGEWHEGVDAAIASHLSHDDELVVATAIDALRLVGRMPWLEIRELGKHGSPYVRGAALRFAKARNGRGALDLLASALTDAHAIVRSTALDELEGLADHSMIGQIQPLLADEDGDVRLAARTLLESISS